MGSTASPSTVASHAPTLLLVPTERDVWVFRLFRAVVGFVVLGLTAVFALFSLGPLVVEGRMRSPESTPSAPSPPFTLWSEHDSQALRTIIIISSTQAALLLTCWLAVQWRRRHSDERGGRPRTAATKATPRPKQRRTKRLETAQREGAIERARDRCRGEPWAEPLLMRDGAKEAREAREKSGQEALGPYGPSASRQMSHDLGRGSEGTEHTKHESRDDPKS